MKIAIAGSTGLIGEALHSQLVREGHLVKRLVRLNKLEEGILWDPAKKKIKLDELEGFDAIINLCGENIANARWNKEKKKRIRESRLQATTFLVETISRLNNPPKVFLNASAIGFYNHKEGLLTERSTPGSGFLADLSGEWESAVDPLLKLPVRTVFLRFGIVLSRKGGALGSMLTPFRFGLGGVIGTGEQMMSWIDIEDTARAVQFCLLKEEIRGPVNIVAPHPVTNLQFTKSLGTQLSRPTVIPMPSFLARLIFSDMADEMLLTGVHVVPEKLQKSGFIFKYPDLKSSLIHLLQ